MTLEAKNVLRYTGLEYIITHEVTFFFPIEAEHLTQNLDTIN